MFQENVEDLADELDSVNFLQGFNLPRSGARQVDLKGRRYQEAAELLNVSRSENCFS